MGLALGTAAIVLVVLLWELARPTLKRTLARARELWAGAQARAAHRSAMTPGRERRAEQRARELLRSCVNEHDWAMYRDLGFLRVWGGLGERAQRAGTPPYAYLIYPHKPIVAYVPRRPASCSTSTASRSPTTSQALRQRAAARLRRRAGQVDGADAPTSAGWSARPTCTCPGARSTPTGCARPRAPGALGARARSGRACSGSVRAA